MSVIITNELFQQGTGVAQSEPSVHQQQETTSDTESSKFNDGGMNYYSWKLLSGIKVVVDSHMGEFNVEVQHKVTTCSYINFMEKKFWQFWQFALRRKNHQI